MSNEMPPLGLRPKYIVDSLRIREILEALDRYNRADTIAPIEWIDELHDICSSQQKWKEGFVP